MRKIIKSLFVAAFISKFLNALKTLRHLLDLRSIFILIIAGIFAQLYMPINMNTTSRFVFENKNKTISLWETNTSEMQERVKVEKIKKQQQWNFNQAAINFAEITFPFQEEETKERSDLFYYILGIIILIVSAFLLRQRYKQYLEEKDKLNQ